jgi:hypothetical protein
VRQRLGTGLRQGNGALWGGRVGYGWGEAPCSRGYFLFPLLLPAFLHRSFDNNSLGNHGDNCASFQKAMITEREIKQGKGKA